MKYYIVINEWLYPTESGREIISDYDSRKEAEEEVTTQGMKEYDNFLKVNEDTYTAACGLYHNQDGSIAGYALHSSQYEEEDMYFRSFIVEIESW